ncbi:Hpt domain-containing protein [Azospirillum doebereinerae]|nr:Hpt domain-containing protein [Azospirillum doebereinerae]
MPPPDPSFPAPAPVLDLDHLRLTFGALDADTVAMMDFFLETTAPALAQARAALTAGDADTARAAAHSAAGAARTAGARALAVHCAALETALVARRPAEAEHHAQALEPAFQAVKDAIGDLRRAVEAAS